MKEYKTIKQIAGPQVQRIDAIQEQAGNPVGEPGHCRRHFDDRAAEAHAAIEHTDLRAALFFQGYEAHEFRS